MLKHAAAAAAAVILVDYQNHKAMVVQGALSLLNVKTGVETVSEVEANAAFIVLLLLTEDITKDKH